MRWNTILLKPSIMYYLQILVRDYQHPTVFDSTHRNLYLTIFCEFLGKLYFSSSIWIILSFPGHRRKLPKKFLLLISTSRSFLRIYFFENFYYSAVREGDKFYDMLKLSYCVCINFPDKSIVHASTRIFCGFLGNQRFQFS